MDLAAQVSPPRAGHTRSVIGRYVLDDEIAAGAMSSVCLARVHASDTAAGGVRTVLVKRLNGELVRDVDFVAAAMDGAERSDRLRHPNVLAPMEVLWVERRELLFATEYVPGETLAILFGACFRSGVRMPAPVAVAIVTDVLRALHAAHEARDDADRPAPLLHGGLTPQNVLVGTDGVARVMDFGLAAARSRLRDRPPSVTVFFSKGKSAHMSPEQVRRQPIDRRTDVFSAAVILWELLTGERLFRDTGQAAILAQITTHDIPAPSAAQSDVTGDLDAVLARALQRNPEARTASAATFAEEIAAALPPASAEEVAAWVAGAVTDRLRERAELVSLIESSPLPPPDPGVKFSRPGSTTSGPMPVLPASPPWARAFPSWRRSKRSGRQRRRRGPMIAVVSGALLLSTVLVMVLRRSPPPPAPPTSASSSPTPSPSASVPVPEPAKPAAPPPSSARAPSASSRPAGGGAASARPTQRPPAPRSERARAETTARPTPPSRSAAAARTRGAASEPAARATRNRNASKNATRPARSAARPGREPAAAAAVGRAKNSRPAPDCDPPYVVDADGIRRLKKECLPR